MSLFGEMSKPLTQTVAEKSTVSLGATRVSHFQLLGSKKGTQDDRHLWPWMFEIIKHKRPSLVLCENVSGHIALGLDEVLLDLEGEGYSTRAFVIPASAVDANHKRERVWIVAYANTRDVQAGCKRSGEYARNLKKKNNQITLAKRSEIERPTDVANTDSRMRRGGEQSDRVEKTNKGGYILRKKNKPHMTYGAKLSDAILFEEKQKMWPTPMARDWKGSSGRSYKGLEMDLPSAVKQSTKMFPTPTARDYKGQNSLKHIKEKPKTQQSVTKLSKTKRHSGKFERRLGGVVDGVPTWMDEPDIPRVTTNQAGRVQRLKMLGNAVVPQVVYQLGLAMKELWDEV